MAKVLLLSFTFAVSFLLTAGICRNAKKWSLVDVPNERSSHFRPTPRGGGIAIVISFSASLLYSIFSSSAPFGKPGYYLSAILLTAAVGLWDDLRRVSILWRLPLHLISSLLIIIPLLGQSDIDGFVGLDLGRPLNLVVMVIALSWLLNLYNFMDGIDGIASSEAIFVAIGGAILLYYTGQTQLAELLLCLAAASAGFLLWNWPPAKIFMGDVGSGFLGLALGGTALYSITASDSMTIWPWLILLGIFLVDATYTLVARILKRQRWYAAHCSHTYQIAAFRFKSHCQVTSATIYINIFWLFPLAFLATKFPRYGIFYTLIAFAPLVCLAAFFKAGNPKAEP